MSFESYLTYDQPHKRKRKVKTSATAGKEKERKGRDSERWAKNSNLVQNFPLVSANRSEQRQPAEVHSALMGEVCTEAPPVLPDPTSSPSVQADHSPPPAYDLMSSFQPNATPLSSPRQEEGAGFTGYRINSKTQVYSGPRHGYLTPVTSHQQRSQVLSNKGSLSENRGLPHSVFQSALGQGTPDQLYPTEKCNQDAAEETDQFWRLRCHKEFKEETPKENESWQEMYLRLQDARERRLQALTKRIRAAHPQEPQGRKTKMIFLMSPWGVPGRQEKFGTAAAAACEEPKFQPAQHPTGSSDTGSGSGSGSSSSSSSNPSSSGRPSSYPSSTSRPSSSSSSRPSSYPSSTSSPSTSSSSSSRSSGGSFNPAAQRPTDASLNTARAHLAPPDTTKRPASTKIAPLMAKTIKDYKRSTWRK